MIYIISALCSIVLIAFDQLSKYYISSHLVLYQSINIIDGFFNITYVTNTGAAWSMFQGKINMFIILTIIALILFIYYFVKANKNSKLEIISLILMFSGCVGNFIDRLTNQCVIDFLDFIIFGYDFPVFNLADSFLVIGVGLYLLKILMERNNAKD